MIKNRSRRNFLRNTAFASPLLLTIFHVQSCKNNKSHLGNRWVVLFAVQEHLFPKTDDSPGAAEINATRYLKEVFSFSGFDIQIKKIILDGIEKIQNTSFELTDRSFVDLSTTSKERVLQHVKNKTNWGERCLSFILLFIFEALLSDPCYGGNPNKIGWNWLEHRPGTPRPTEEINYFKLAER